MGKGIAYLRRSTSKQEQSLEEQLAWALRVAEQHGVQLDASLEALRHAVKVGKSVAGDVYFDDGITGSDLQRPGLIAFLERVTGDASITHVFYRHRDRLARPDDPLDATKIESRIRQAGNTVILEHEVMPPLKTGEVDIGGIIKGVLGFDDARKARRLLASRTLTGQSDRARKGFRAGGRAPYGFVRAKFNLQTGQVEERIPDGQMIRGEGIRVVAVPGDDPESLKKLEVVRRIAEMYHAGIGGLHRIAEILNEEGVEPPDPGHSRRKVTGWNAVSVREVLEQPLYIGKARWGRSAEGVIFRYDKTSSERFRAVEADEVHSASKGRKKYYRELDEWVLEDVPCPFEPIVNPDIWHANFEKLKARGKETRGVPKAKDAGKYPLRVVCGDCGAAMSGERRRDKKGRWEPLSYVCSTYKGLKGKKCHRNVVSRDALVWYALHSIRGWLDEAGNKTALEQEIRGLLDQDASARSDLDRRRSEVARKIEAVEHQRKQAYAEKVGADDPDLRADAEALWNQKRDDKRALERQLEAIDHERQLSGCDVEAEVEAAMAVLDDLYQLVKDPPADQLREVFTAFDVTVVVEFNKQQRGKRLHSTPAGGQLLLAGAEPKRKPPVTGEPQGDLLIMNRGDMI